ncbi:hypothetical protein QZH41_006163 [Actinostola sp. cb2023]|nr:hypothetical protein QZH41_006163 [Actinostola sp. cb2023]
MELRSGPILPPWSPGNKRKHTAVELEPDLCERLKELHITIKGHIEKLGYIAIGGMHVTYDDTCEVLPAARLDSDGRRCVEVAIV